MRRRTPLLIVAASLAATGWLWSRQGSPRRPLRYACWYWHHPFALSPADVEQLRAARIERLYVHAGTLTVRRGQLALVSRQRWGERPPTGAWAVIRVHPECHGRLLAPGGVAQAVALLRDAKLPPYVAGVQWDADIPTARLPQYAAFLRAVRPLLPQGHGLSVTALPDWLRSRDYAALCDAVDEIAPQFYGNRWSPQVREEPAPSLWETDGLLAQARRAAAGRARVWIGLPAYGRCLVVDRDGRAVGVRHDLDPSRLLDDPAWTVTHARTRRATIGDAVPVEDELTLRCAEAAPAGLSDMPAGTSLLFQWPRASGVQGAARALAAEGLPGVAGICLFRWPAAGEPLSVPVSSFSGTEAGPGTRLRPLLTRTGASVAVSVANEGAEGPLLGEDVRLEVTPAGGEVLEDGLVEWRRGELPASRLRADRAVLRRAWVRPGGRWEACEVRAPRGQVTATVRWQGADGAWHEATEVLP